MSTEQNTKPNPSGLHAKIAAITAAITSVEKDGRNDQHNYNYVSESAFLEAVRMEMSNRNVTLFPHLIPGTLQIHDRAVTNDKGFITTCVVGYTFTDADTGESFTAEIPTQGFDSLDKGAFKAMTGGIKYALRQVFMIPTGDDPEHPSTAGAERSDRVEDTLQMEALPPDKPFNATVREAKWLKAKGVDKILLIAGVANTNPEGLDAGEKLWLEPGKPDFDQFVQHVCDGIIPPAGSSLVSLNGRPFDITVTYNGDWRNHTISAYTPAEATA